MPTFASFEDVHLLGVYLLGAAFLILSWIVSAIAALGALVLSLRRITRGTAVTWASASILASIPIAVFDGWVLLKLKDSGDLVAGWPFLAVSLAPLAVGTCVCGFAWAVLLKQGSGVPKA